MAYYMISYDLNNCTPEDHGKLHDRIQKYFVNSCKILSTTYLIKTNNTKDEITDWFIAQMNNKNDIGLSIVKYVEHQYWLIKSISDCVDKIHN